MPYADGHLSSEQSDQVSRHVSTCKACASELHDLRQVVGVLRQTEYAPMEPAFDIRSRIMSEISTSPARRSWWTVPAYRYSAMAASVLLLGLTATGLLLHREPTTTAREVAMATESGIRAGSARPQPLPGSALGIPGTPGTPGTSTPTADTPRIPTPTAIRRKAAVIVASKPPAAAKKSIPTIIASADIGDRRPFGKLGSGESDALSTKSVMELDRTSRQTPMSVGGMESPAPQATRGPQGPAGPPSPSPEADPGQVQALMAEKSGAGSIEQAAPAQAREPGDEHPGILRNRMPETASASRKSVQSEDVNAAPTTDPYDFAVKQTSLYPASGRHWFARAVIADKKGMISDAVISYRRAIRLGVGKAEKGVALHRLQVLGPMLPR